MMKSLDLKITGYRFLSPVILIDNEKVKFKVNNFGSLTTKLETEKDELEIEIFNYHLLKTKLWLPLSILFFIISIFGIFDIKDEYKEKSINFKGKIQLSEENNTLNIEFDKFKNEEMAFTTNGNATLASNDSNKYYLDSTILKRRKILKYVKIGIIALALIALALIVLL